MAKGGRSKRWTRTQGSDRSTVTQNSKNGTTWSFSNGSGNSRTTVSHRPDGRIVRTTTVRYGDGYTSRTSQTVSGKKERQKSYSSPLRRTRGNSSDGLELVGPIIIGCLLLVKWLVTKKWFWFAVGTYLLYAAIVNVLQANIGY
jgi:hypothetical protein